MSDLVYPRDWLDRIGSIALDQVWPKPRLRVALDIYCRCREDGTRGLASVTQQATRLGLSERTVKRCRAQLVAAGWLVVEQRGGRQGHREATMYRLAVGGVPVDDPRATTERESGPSPRADHGPSTGQARATAEREDVTLPIHPVTPSSASSSAEAASAPHGADGWSTARARAYRDADQQDLAVVLSQLGNVYDLQGTWDAMRRDGKDWPGRFAQSRGPNQLEGYFARTGCFVEVGAS